MFEIKNKKNYYTSRIGMSLLILIGFVLMQFFYSSIGLVWLVIVGSVEFIYLFSKFTSRIGFDENNIVISYFRFFFEREIRISCDDAEMKLLKSASLRSAGHLILRITVGKRTVYELDSRDGFSEDKLIGLRDAYSSFKSKQK